MDSLTHFLANNIVLTFVATFPLRIFAALLQGLQDLTFLGIVQFSSWGGGVVVTFLAAAMGWGLYALACGWITTQIVTVAFAWRRLSRTHPDVLPSTRRQGAPGVWMKTKSRSGMPPSGL